MGDALQIPAAPDFLLLPIERSWDGGDCREPRLHGRVRLQTCGDGLAVEASLPHQRVPRVPDEPRGARVADLWEYDVVECFLVGAGGRYLEVELGAGGHFLVLAFEAPRRLADAHVGLSPERSFQRDATGWRSRVLIPWSVLPPDLRALNAFVIAGGAHLAYHPLPGAELDFHQPQHFPAARLEPPSRHDTGP
jgi:hypothetical protein